MPSERQRAKSPVRYSRAPGRFENGSRKKSAAGLFPVVEVTATHADAAYIQLTCNADWHRLQVGVQHIEACVGDGATDRHGCG